MPRLSKQVRPPAGTNAYAHEKALVIAFKQVIETKPDEVVADMVEVEYLWFSRTRAEILQTLYNSAVKGSDYAIKIYYEWMRDNERDHEKLLSQPRQLNAVQAVWTQKALKSGVKSTAEQAASQPASGPDVSTVSDSDIAESPANIGQE